MLHKQKPSLHRKLHIRKSRISSSKPNIDNRFHFIKPKAVKLYRTNYESFITYKQYESAKYWPATVDWITQGLYNGLDPYNVLDPDFSKNGDNPRHPDP